MAVSACTSMQPEAVTDSQEATSPQAPRFGSWSALKQRLKEVKQSTLKQATQQPATDISSQHQGASPHDDDDASTVISETSSVVQQKLELLLRPAGTAPTAAGPAGAAAEGRAGAIQAGSGGGLNLTVRRFKSPSKVPADDTGGAAVTSCYTKPATDIPATATAAATTTATDSSFASRPHLRLSVGGNNSSSVPATAAAHVGELRQDLLVPAAAAAAEPVLIATVGMPLSRRTPSSLRLNLPAAADSSDSSSRAAGPTDCSRIEAGSQARCRSNSVPAVSDTAIAAVAYNSSRRRTVLDSMPTVMPAADAPTAAASTVPAASAFVGSGKRSSSSGVTPAAAAAGNNVSAAQAAAAALPTDTTGAPLQLQLPASRFREHSGEGAAPGPSAGEPPQQQQQQQQPVGYASGRRSSLELRAGSTAAAAAAVDSQQLRRPAAGAPHIFAAFQVPAHLYNTQEDILNDADIRELLGKVENCVGVKDHSKVHWHVRTNSTGSAAADAAAVGAATAAAVGMALTTPGVLDLHQGAARRVSNSYLSSSLTGGTAHSAAAAAEGREIHVHVGDDGDGQLSVIISDMDDPDNSLVLQPPPGHAAAAAAAAGSSAGQQQQQHTVLELSVGPSASPPSVISSSFSLAARRSSTGGGTPSLLSEVAAASRVSSVAGGMRPTIGSMIAARLSISDIISAQHHHQQHQQQHQQQQQQHGDNAHSAAAAATPNAAVEPAEASNVPKYSPEMRKSASLSLGSALGSRSTAAAAGSSARRSVEAAPVVVGLSSAALAAAEQQQRRSSREVLDRPNARRSLEQFAEGILHGAAAHNPSTVPIDDAASSLCDTQSDLSALANPLQFADTLKQRMAKHLWTPTAAAAAEAAGQGGAGGAHPAAAAAAAEGIVSPGSTAQQLEEYFKGHESLQRRADRLKLNLQQRQQKQKQQCSQTAAPAADNSSSSRFGLSKTIGGAVANLASSMRPNMAAAAAAANRGLGSRSAKVLQPAAAVAAAESGGLLSTYPPRSPSASSTGFGPSLTAAVNSLLLNHQQQCSTAAAAASIVAPAVSTGLTSTVPHPHHHNTRYGNDNVTNSRNNNNSNSNVTGWGLSTAPAGVGYKAGTVAGPGSSDNPGSVAVAATAGLNIRQSLIRASGGGLGTAAAAAAAAGKDENDDTESSGLNVDELKHDLEVCLRKVG